MGMRVVSVLLLAAGAAKLASSFGAARILDQQEPLFHLTFRAFFKGVGFIEVLGAALCLSHISFMRKAAVLAVISFCILCYRYGIALMGYHQPCNCLGTFTETLGLSPSLADDIMKMILLLMLSVSAGALCLEHWLLRPVGSDCKVSDRAL